MWIKIRPYRLLAIVLPAGFMLGFGVACFLSSKLYLYIVGMTSITVGVSVLATIIAALNAALKERGEP